MNVGGAPGTELFVVSDVRRLRLYVQVPQSQVAAIRPGRVAKFTVPEKPGQVFNATVQSMAHRTFEYPAKCFDFHENRSSSRNSE